MHEYVYAIHIPIRVIIINTYQIPGSNTRLTVSFAVNLWPANKKNLFLFFRNKY